MSAAAVPPHIPTPTTKATPKNFVSLFIRALYHILSKVCRFTCLETFWNPFVFGLVLENSTMAPEVTIFLLSIAAIFIIGAVGEIFFQRTSVPDVIWLIAAGILLGPVLGLVHREQLTKIAPYFAALTIVVVLFEGGMALKLSELSEAAPRSSLLAVLSFFFSAGAIAVISKLVAWIGWLPPSWTWLHGWMLGAILGGSSSVIIMPAMARANLAPKLSNLVNLESALTDAFCVVGTSALVSLLQTGSNSAADPVIALGKSFGIGLGAGLVAGLLSLLLLRFIFRHEHAYPITLSSLLVLYVLIDHAGGSAALGIFTVAIVLGNAPALSTKIGLVKPVGLDTDLRGFHRQMTFMIKSFFFVFIGAMLAPPWGLLAMGLLLGIVLLGARIPVVGLATIKSGLTFQEKQIAVVSLPRGMAAGVLATLPVSAKIAGTEGVPSIAFACVITTILAFSIGFPLIRRQMPATTKPSLALETEPASMTMPSHPDQLKANPIVKNLNQPVDSIPPLVPNTNPVAPVAVAVVEKHASEGEQAPETLRTPVPSLPSVPKAVPKPEE
jgi:potassium/hydrogen antiporter